MFDQQCLRNDASRPPGPNSRARVIKKCRRSTKRSRMGPDRTVTAWVYKSMK